MSLPAHDTHRLASDASARLGHLDALRAFAALWVVAYHLDAGGHLPRLKEALPAGLYTAIFANGYLGVVVFFVISGFVMSRNLANVRVDVHAAGTFLARRLARLTPPYYAAVAFALAITWMRWRYGTGSVAAPDLSAGNLLAHATYTQDVLRYPQADPVFWTLCIEIQFYLAVVLMFWGADVLRAKLPGVLWARWAAVASSCLLALWWMPGPESATERHDWFLPYWYTFMTGVLLEHAARAPRAHIAAVMLAAWAVSLLALASKLRTPELAATVATLAFIHAATLLKTRPEWRWLRVLPWLGTVSYSIYLIHNPLSMLSIPLLKKLTPPGLASDIVVLAGSIVVCVAASWAMYRLIERPAIAFSRRFRASGIIARHARA